ncbi:MAG: YceI family protein [Lentimicrobium sp.]|jgi:polyisoprenoid-binding protein YceI|nr:YceI family protein [Lentimicrobium sp.]
MRFFYSYNKQLALLIFGVIFLVLFTGFAVVVSKNGKGHHYRHYTIDVSNSYIFWRLDAHRGVIPFSNGKLVFEGDKLVDAQFKVCMDSLRDLDIDYELMRTVLENTIKSKEIFHTSRYPHAFFRFDAAEPVSTDSLLITGDLEIRGIENCISFNTFIKQNGGSFTASTDTISIDRIRWGVIAMSKEFGKSDDGYVISDKFQLQIMLAGNLEVERGRHPKR